MKFKLPSITRIISGFEAAIRRFPLAMLAALAGTVIGITMIHMDEPGFYANVLMVLVLAFFLFVAIVLLAEQRGWDKKQIWLWELGAAAFLVIYYWLLPDNIFEAENLFIIRYTLWAIGFVLLLTFVPFLVKSEDRTIRTFWNYNLHLVLSAALTVIWAGAIQAGVSIAMASVDYLFDINIAGERYMELWIVIVGIFSTAFFLARLPKNVHEFESIDSYPNELRLFSQYVLVPLVSLYFLILYAYVVRILVTGEWPKGTLAYMIIGFSFLGVLTYVSLYPLRQSASWIRKYGTAFYFALIPQVGMLFWALWFRISEYAITESRYYVLIFGCWLLVMALYFLLNKRKDIRTIPITLFAIVLLTSFGPWGAFAVSEDSQINRLEGLLVRNELLAGSKVIKADHDVPKEDAREISAIVRYLSRVHGLEGIQPWFDQDLKTLEISGNDPGVLYPRKSYDLPSTVVEELIGIDYVEQWEGPRLDDEYFNFYTDFRGDGNLIDVSQYDYLVQISGYYNISGPKAAPSELSDGQVGDIDGDEYTYGLDDGQVLVIKKNQEIIAEVDISGIVNSLLQNEDSYSASLEELTLDYANNNLKLRLQFDNISGELVDGEIMINSFNARLLFSLLP